MTAVEATPGYQALHEHAAWIDFSGRGKIRVTGDDRARLLHAMTTNHIEQLQPGEGCYAFFLNAQGHILADAHILCFIDHFELDFEPKMRQKVYEHLDRYIIADDVTIEDETDRIASINVEGPESFQVLIKLGVVLPETPDSWTTLPGSGAIVARLSYTGSDGFTIFSPVAEKDAIVARLGISQATPEDARVVRIENGRPSYGEEITDRNLVQETGQLQAVHFNKGCYLGQEIVERVRTQAHIHRVLRKLEIDTHDPPPRGTKNEAAEIAGAVFSPALQKTVALAYVRTQFAEPGTEFVINSVRARVVG